MSNSSLEETTASITHLNLSRESTPGEVSHTEYSPIKDYENGEGFHVSEFKSSKVEPETRIQTSSPLSVKGSETPTHATKTKADFLSDFEKSTQQRLAQQASAEQAQLLHQEEQARIYLLKHEEDRKALTAQRRAMHESAGCYDTPCDPTPAQTGTPTWERVSQLIDFGKLKSRENVNARRMEQILRSLTKPGKGTSPTHSSPTSPTR